jgi:hypothetical protein
MLKDEGGKLKDEGGRMKDEKGKTGWDEWVCWSI